MRRLLNIAIVVSIYGLGFWAAHALLQGNGAASIAMDVTRWLWGLGALMIGSLAQLLWKVHDAKRVEGLSSTQRARVRYVAGLISARIYLLIAVVFLASVVGFMSNFMGITPLASALAQGALGAMLSSALLWLTWMHFTQSDLQRFEDKAREEAAQQKAADALGERLKKAIEND